MPWDDDRAGTMSDEPKKSADEMILECLFRTRDRLEDDLMRLWKPIIALREAGILVKGDDGEWTVVLPPPIEFDRQF